MYICLRCGQCGEWIPQIISGPNVIVTKDSTILAEDGINDILPSKYVTMYLKRLNNEF